MYVPPPRVFALTLGTAVASVFWLGVLLVGSPAGGDADAGASAGSADDAALAAETRRLVAEGEGIWDGHPDPDVGRVLQPELTDRRVGKIRVTSNAFGVRERDWEVPKPAGRTRIVVLGDSYVFGNGVAAEDRLGAHLERALVERAGLDVEVLHIGMTDWNLVASANYLRRQLHLVQPDLVVHVLIYNDLDDASAVRGFGATAAWSSQVRRHADGVVNTRHPYVMGFGGVGPRQSLLNAGLDHESRERYGGAREAMGALARDLELRGARYLALLHWPDHTAVAARELLDPLPPASRGYVPSSVFRDRQLRVGWIDAHWNARGHALVAKFVYGLIAERDLLAPVALAPWPEAAERVRRWQAEGEAEASAPFDVVARRRGVPVRARLSFDALTALVAAQVHGGVDRDGRAAPYASFVLANRQAGRLLLVVEPLADAHLQGFARVAVDGVSVGSFELGGPGGAERFLLPDELRARPYLNVSITSDDWSYAGPRLDRCVAYRLVEAALESDTDER